MKQKFFCLFLCMIFLLTAATSCGDSSNNEDKKDSPPVDVEENTAASDSETKIDYFDSLPAKTFGNAEFIITTVKKSSALWLTMIYDTEEITADILNDAVYNRNRKIENRFDVVIKQREVEDALASAKKSIKAGDNSSSMYMITDRDALVLGLDGLCLKMSEIPNINLDMPYWSKTLNKSMSIKNELYFAYGSYNFTTYDYTHVLLFNKNMLSNLGLESPYKLVESGKWTYDTFSEMAKAAVSDVDGNGIFNSEDNYGLLSQPKHVLPCFWISAGANSISKNSQDEPQFILRTDSKFTDVIQKIFEMTYDTKSWYVTQEIANDSTTLNKMFEEEHGLFLNSTFFYISALRNMISDFGIVPYPKYNEEQSTYYSRVEGGQGGIIPITNKNLDMTGMILEALNAESAQSVIPVYYDIALKTKFVRDEESPRMLDLIFDNRVYDLGDTYWCNLLRDGMFLTMFSKNNRDLTSQLEKVEGKVNAEIEKSLNPK